MPASDDHFGPGRQRSFAPYLDPNERRKLYKLLDVDARLPASFAAELRALARKYVDDSDSTKLRAVCLLVADLCEQGWLVSIKPGGITFEPPGISRNAEQTVDDVKSRVRQALQAARQRQLDEPAVQQFLARMERRPSTAAGGRSVLDLIDNGAELSKELRRINAFSKARREKALAKLIDPVVEICESGAKCTVTGLPLIDIWRYFRHTWAHEYRSVPGRQMLILIRNAGRPNRPVMGIAMLASPVMRLGPRDQWIGWQRETAQARLQDGSWTHRDLARSLIRRVEKSISAIRSDDLVSAAEIKNPTERVSLRLEQKASGANFAREAQLRAHYKKHRDSDGSVKPHRGTIGTTTNRASWRRASEDLLFVRKRAEGLSHLLFAKSVFRSVGLGRKPEKGLTALFATRDGQKALDIAFTELRKAGLSSEIADVSVCGAAHPYNEVLGGKLVALLLTSKEMRDAYAKRYGGQTSVIASQMAGRAIKKPAQLRILTTTSLYGVGSSQYNRLVLRSEEHPDLPYEVRWGAIGKSLTGGFGTLHLGSDTAQALRGMALSRHDSRRVNNRFGEGTSPRLRQIREGLDALGLKSDTILHHATPRLFYGCELAPGARMALLGLGEAEPNAPSVSALASAWRHRWLSKRVLREETLRELARLGPTSVRASLHADKDGQFLLPIALPGPPAS